MTFAVNFEKRFIELCFGIVIMFILLVYREHVKAFEGTYTVYEITCRTCNKIHRSKNKFMVDVWLFFHRLKCVRKDELK